MGLNLNRQQLDPQVVFFEINQGMWSKWQFLQDAAQ